MNRKLGYGAQLRANLDPTKGVGRLRQQDGGHGSRNPLRIPNPSAVGGLLELLPRRERVVACRSGDGLGTGPSGPLPRASNSQLRTGRLRPVDPGGRHCQVGSLAGAAHLLKDNAGVLR
ncbi:hypothetical protein JHK82_035013 [Glycine max]|uniref:Uncharacterized protein n=1 Tax=Glycine max TaxID=3847 RepID=A0A0R0GPP7_SOYBN|nr:hypothetical protein JHK86_035162 [Glycine max]KAG5070663.1 hypothetical protein JHK84_057317 [Glycine max]KAG5070672.1 hypothetical protein JHK84_057326 [Glycine max]KAG5111744.1 hypothetical protein JHK82_035013 [Glycine max]